MTTLTSQGEQKHFCTNMNQSWGGVTLHVGCQSAIKKKIFELLSLWDHLYKIFQLIIYYAKREYMWDRFWFW